MNGKFKQIPRAALAALGLGMAGPAWAQDDFATTYSATYNRYAYIDGEPTPLILYEAGGGPAQATSYTSSQGDLPGGGGAPARTGRPAHWASAARPAPIHTSPQAATGTAAGQGSLGGAAGPPIQGGSSGRYPSALESRGGAAGTPGAGGSTGQFPAPGPGMPGAPEMPGAAGPPGTAAPPTAAATPGIAAPPTPVATPPPATFSPGLGGAPSLGGGSLNMIGDLSPLLSIRQVPGFPNPPPPPPPSERTRLAPSIRGFKIAENQSPIPQDRVYYNFNYFEDANKTLNDFFETPIDDLSIYRHVFGFEKTFNRGKGSLGARLPLNTVHADSREPSLNSGGTFTSLGNLTLIGKYVLEQNTRTGDLISVGLSITPPTGTERLANAPFLTRRNTTTIQPFLAYYLSRGRFFLHGFTALDVPVDPTDVTLLYNDVGLGYFLYQSRHNDRLLTAVVPTVEVHVNTPLNHRGAFDRRDPSGTPDIVNITTGMNFEFSRRSVVTLGIVNPVTSPRPFDFEAVVLWNIRFGGARRRPIFPQIAG